MQILQENTFIGVLFELINFLKKHLPKQELSCEICKIHKNTIFYRTFPVAAPAAAILLDQGIGLTSSPEQFFKVHINDFLRHT